MTAPSPRERARVDELAERAAVEASDAEERALYELRHTCAAHGVAFCDTCSERDAEARAEWGRP